jgi:hypothetical protein
MRRILTTLFLACVLALLAAPLASADPCNGAGNGGPGNGGGAGGGGGNNCQNAPEASSALLFPLAAVGVIGGYVLLTRRRRTADL